MILKPSMDLSFAARFCLCHVGESVESHVSRARKGWLSIKPTQETQRSGSGNCKLATERRTAETEVVLRIPTAHHPALYVIAVSGGNDGGIIEASVVARFVVIRYAFVENSKKIEFVVIQNFDWILLVAI